MEFLEEETRPRFHFHSRSSQSQSSDESQPSDQILRPSLFISLSLSALLFSLSFFSPPSEPFHSLLLWLSLSLLLGPFSPSSLTSGDIRVGLGKLLPDPFPSDPDITHFSTRRSKKPVHSVDSRRIEGTPFPESAKYSSKTEEDPVPESAQLATKSMNSAKTKEEREWREGDLETLKKLLVKNPVGKPKRWEVITEAFNGAYKVESVIRAAKSLGEKRSDDSDSYARFLKDRKPLDRKVSEEEGWSGGDDVALLNALKAFPKETAMRWEKIAMAVPGKTKAACVKRVAELTKGFRSSKGLIES